MVQYLQNFKIASFRVTQCTLITLDVYLVTSSLVLSFYSRQKIIEKLSNNIWKYLNFYIDFKVALTFRKVRKKPGNLIQMTSSPHDNIGWYLN